MDTITLPTSLDFSFLLSLDNEPLRDFDGKPIGEPLGLENSLWRAPQGVTRCVRAVDAPPVAVTCPSRSIGFRQESVGSWGQVTSHCLNAAEELLTKLSSSVATSGTGPVTASDGASPLFAASVSALYVGTPLHDRVAKNLNRCYFPQRLRPRHDRACKQSSATNATRHKKSSSKNYSRRSRRLRSPVERWYPKRNTKHDVGQKSCTVEANARQPLRRSPRIRLLMEKRTLVPSR